MLKDDDWLSSAVDVDAIADPKTSVATCIEVQYAMEGEWGLDRLTTIHDRLDANEITIVPLRIEHLDAGMVLQRAYDRLNQFDAIHLGAAMVLEEPIVSTDTLYPDIVEVDHIDPRELA